MRRVSRRGRVALGSVAISLAAVAAPAAGATEWSPATALLAYTSRDSGDPDIWLRHGAGGEAVNLTASPGLDLGASWFPDGRRLVFQSSRDGQREVYRMAADGSDVVNLTNHPAQDLLARVSPDGRRIAFFSDRGIEHGPRQLPGHLYIMPTDGGEAERVTREPLTSTFAPDWSPDGGSLLFARDFDGDIDLVLLDLATGDEKRLHGTDAAEYGGAFSPEGERIAFHAEEGGEARIVVMRLDGSERRELTRGGSHYNPRWSPDARWLLFTGAPLGEGSFDLLMVAAAGDGVEPLVAGPGDERAGAWAPIAAAGEPTTSDRELYRATIAAANAELRLHDTAAARGWLELAPAELRGWEWEYLDAEADASSGVFRAHSAAVVDMALSPDGRTLATCGGNEVALWDTATGERRGRLEGHTKTVWNARFSPDGARLATVSSDGTLRLWDGASGAELWSVEGVGDGVAGVAWRPDGDQLATVSWRRLAGRGVVGVLDLWSAANGEHLHHLEHGIKPVVAVGYAPDGERLWVGTWDFDLGIYDTATWEPVSRLVPPDDGVYKAIRESRASPDGSRLAAAHEDGAVRVWNARSGELEHTLRRQAEGVRLAINDLVWLAGNERLATASTDLTVRLWGAANGEHLAVLHGHTRRVTALAASADGRTLWSGDSGGEVRRWDLAALAPELRRWRLPDVGYGVAVSQDGRRAASAGWTGWAGLFDLDSGALEVSWEAHETSGVRASWAPGDKLLATTGNDGMVRVWDPGVSPPRLVLERAVEIQSSAVEFSADGRLLASPASGQRVLVWPLDDAAASGEAGEVSAVKGESATTDLAWHPARPLLALAGTDGVIRLWDPRTDELVASLPDHGEGPLQVAFSHDGARLAAASASGTIRVWQLEPELLLHEMSVAAGGQSSVAFAPGDHRLATAGNDDSVHIWDPASGAHLLRIPFAETPWDIAWSRDGGRLLVIPLDGTIRVLGGGRRGGAR